MTRIIDLSLPIEDHFRWPVERRVKGDHDRGDVFQATWLGWFVVTPDLKLCESAITLKPSGSRV